MLLQTLDITEQSIADDTDSLESIKKTLHDSWATKRPGFGNETVCYLNSEISRLTLLNISFEQKLAPSVSLIRRSVTGCALR